MRILLFPFVAVAALVAGVSFARAGDLLPPTKTIEEVVDHYVDAKLKEAGVTPAPQAKDANLIRRLTLDLVGRIPAMGETKSYVDSTDAAKRTKLVEHLLAGPAYARHQATEFDVMLMEGTRGSIRDYLLQALRDNRPWDQIFREVMLPNEGDPQKKQAGEFLKQRVRDADKLTAEASAVFFGVNVSCARCHDHPLVHDWKQAHYYGMKSFFARTFDNGGFLAERDYGLIKFKTTAGLEHQAKLMFLTGKVVDAPAQKPPSGEDQKRERARLDEFRKKKMPLPPPSFSARGKLVELALEPGQNDFFARSIVNRVWHRLFGFGLVMPVDQMHSENPPSHPELLQWLARDLVEHKYDLRRLIRGLALSRAYNRGSRWEQGEVPKPQLFAVAPLRALTPMQLSTSLWLATTDPDSFSAKMKPEDFEKRIEGLEGRARDFARLIEQPRENFQIGVGEALLFSNNDRMQREFLADGGDRLIGHLKKIKEPNQLIDTAVRSVLSRAPSAEEIKLLSEFLKQRENRPVEGYRQMVWALLTSSEFRFNY